MDSQRTRVCVDARVNTVEVEVTQEKGHRRILELLHGLGFDLADTLPRYPVHLADCIQRFS